MKLEQQVPTLELCKKLKDLGYPQEGLWFWAVEMKMGNETNKWSLCQHSHLLPEHPKYVAPTVAEMGEWLPNVTIDKWVGDNSWMVEYCEDGKTVEGKTQANARAKMLIWLVENTRFQPVRRKLKNT